MEASQVMCFFVYIVECSSDKSLYTGWTTDLSKRLKAHNAGKASKYTRSRIPVSYVYWEKMTDKRQAMKREYAIKQMTRKEKLRLINLHHNQNE